MASRDRNEHVVPTSSKAGKKNTMEGGWSGDAVARAPDGEAEDAALRAAGNGPRLVRDVLAANRTDTDRSVPKFPATKRMTDEEMKKSQQLKQEAAAEEHRAVQAARGKGPHGSL